MMLSEAIRYGRSLRPESHRERFDHVENLGLCSDVYGAACEAVQPKVARLNWNRNDPIKFEAAMNALRAVQQMYFGHYRDMPCQCPLSVQRFTKQGARIINRKGDTKIEWTDDRNLGGVTSECDKVKHMYGMVDHLFYAHGWSTEEVAGVVEWYERKRLGAALVMDFNHYQMN